MSVNTVNEAAWVALEVRGVPREQLAEVTYTLADGPGPHDRTRRCLELLNYASLVGMIAGASTMIAGRHQNDQMTGFCGFVVYLGSVGAVSLTAVAKKCLECNSPN